MEKMIQPKGVVQFQNVKQLSWVKIKKPFSVDTLE